MSIFTKIFGGTNEKSVAKYKTVIEEINKLEPKFESFSDEELKLKTAQFKERLGKGETLDDILPEAFAACREAAKRAIGQRHFDVQLIGGMVLHEGKIAEMKTGEGKTLAATLAVYLNALSGKGAHVVTVNDYLSKRDANWMGSIYHFLGLSTGCIQHEKSYVYEPKKIDLNEVTVEMENLKQVSRREAYAADITYGTNNEFGFDYLRDNMVPDFSEMAQRPVLRSLGEGGKHNFAIVDEVDSILIDEARTPLIISAPDEDSGKLYETFARIVPRLKENEDFNIDEKLRSATLTEEGIEKVEKILGLGNIYTEGGIKYVHHLEQALRAQALFKKDRHYVVKEGEIIIVDEFTGRLMPGRRYSEGLHQALEAKENVTVQKESRTLASITFQNYFRMYEKLSGMTGTAMSSAEEFGKVYNLEVVEVPTHKPLSRGDKSDLIFRTEMGKFKAVIREVEERYKKNQPVLIGTASIDKNELLDQLLTKAGIKHEVLNAKNHEREALIIAKAGEPGAVTVATNMAGRGVDIILGGRIESHNSPQPLLNLRGGEGELSKDSSQEKSEWQKKHDLVVSLGGLAIIGTERHEARRIDDQLRGRAGRQGDPGSSRFFVSLEDDLMRIFAADRIKGMMEFLKMPEDEPIENKMISKAIESAQEKIEGFNFDTRKHVLEYDDVMNKQRETIYRKRREILESKDLKEKTLEAILGEVKKIAQFHAAGYKEEWNTKELKESLGAIMPLPADFDEAVGKIETSENLVGFLEKLAADIYEMKEKQIGFEQMREIEKVLFLRTTDMMWMDHLDEMEHLRDSVRLRAYGQKDPLVEYKNEGHKLFQDLLAAIQAQFTSMIYKVTLTPPENRQSRVANRPSTNSPQASSGNNSVGRNDPCPCGSGKKYKKCCGK